MFEDSHPHLHIESDVVNQVTIDCRNIFLKFSVMKEIEEPALISGSEIVHKNVVDAFDEYLRFNKDKNKKEYVSIGEGLFYNTQGVVFQLAALLALSSHPLVKEVLRNRNIHSNNFPSHELIEKKVLNGVKVLDLGSSPNPVFAEVATLLGAEIYTVDAHKLGFSYQDLQERHIEVDLNEEDAVDIIKQKAGSGFDLVTSSLACTVPMDKKSLKGPTKKVLQQIAHDVLKEGGLYYRAGVGFMVKES